MKLLPLENTDICAIVDDDIYNIVIASGSARNLGVDGYANACGTKLHILVMAVTEAKPADKEVIDHKNRNRLDCRRENLRWATRSENQANTAPKGKLKLKGVSKRGNKYIAYIQKDGTFEYLGYHPDAETAARVYDAAAKQIWGEFAWLNFPSPDRP